MSKEINLYKSLFRKVNLKELNITIPKYMQPLTFVALETDELLQEILNMLAFIGADIHLKEFKRFLLEYKIYEVQKDNSLKEKKFITSATLNNKLKILEFIELIEIRNYRIRLTSQALSYYNKTYSKTESRATLENKLERVTRAKLIAYTSSLILFQNDKDLEKQNIYEHFPNGYVVLKSNDRETIQLYKSKLIKIKNKSLEKIKSNLSGIINTSVKETNFSGKTFKPVTLDKETIEIQIEKEIYDNYKTEIDNIFCDQDVIILDGHIARGKVKVEFKIITY